MTRANTHDTEDLGQTLGASSPDVTATLQQLRKAAYAPGTIPSRHKLLTAAVVSVVIRCEPCIRGYVEWAARKGATREELVEFLNVAIAMQGCPGEEWSAKALRFYDAFRSDRSARAAGGSGASAAAACCTDHGGPGVEPLPSGPGD